jgi:hypothetical protein
MAEPLVRVHEEWEEALRQLQNGKALLRRGTFLAARDATQAFEAAIDLLERARSAAAGGLPDYQQRLAEARRLRDETDARLEQRYQVVKQREAACRERFLRPRMSGEQAHQLSACMTRADEVPLPR